MSAIVNRWCWWAGPGHLTRSKTDYLYSVKTPLVADVPGRLLWYANTEDRKIVGGGWKMLETGRERYGAMQSVMNRLALVGLTAVAVVVVLIALVGAVG